MHTVIVGRLEADEPILLQMVTMSCDTGSESSTNIVFTLSSIVLMRRRRSLLLYSSRSCQHKSTHDVTREQVLRAGRRCLL